MEVSLKEVADFLLENDNYLILTHQFPDGDTLGSATSLCRGLQKLGKNARVTCADPIPQKYQYLFEGIREENFKEETLVCVDIADLQLLGDIGVDTDNIHLCIDHHISNTRYAQRSYVDEKASAACESIYAIFKELNLEIDTYTAKALYTGICTDTGCFKYSNVTPRTMRIAAELMEYDIDAAGINCIMFDTKTRARLEIERMALEGLQYYFDGKCAVMFVTNDMIEKANAKPEDIEGVASMPRQIEGVDVGITLREKAGGGYKLSVRTSDKVNASELCKAFGGGGHARASGCTINESLEESVRLIIEVSGEMLGAK